MSAPSPTCTVQDGASAAAVPTNGADLTTGQTCTIALQSAAGVNVWTLTCIGTDETTTPATVNAALTVNSTTKTATFTAPAAGKSYLFRSTVQGPDGVEYSTTFKTSTLTSAGYRVGATGEKFENHATNGWIGIVNSGARAAGSSMTAATLTAANGTNTKTVTGTLNTLNCSGSPTAIWTLELTSDANSVTFVYNGTSYGANVKYPSGTATYVPAGTSVTFRRFGNEQIPEQNRGFANSRYPQLDDNHIYSWELTEANGTATIPNSVSGGAADTGSVGSGVILGTMSAPWGTCASFDGTSNAAITLPNVLASFTGGVLSAMSIEMWICPDQSSGSANLFNLYDAGGLDCFNLGLSTTVYFQTRTVTTGNITLTSARGRKNDSVWQYIAGTYDGTNMRTYYNGLLAGTAAQSTALKPNNGSTPTWRIGRGNAATYFTGGIGLVRMSNTVRAASYFLANYNRVMGLAA